MWSAATEKIILKRETKIRALTIAGPVVELAMADIVVNKILFPVTAQLDLFLRLVGRRETVRVRNAGGQPCMLAMQNLVYAEYSPIKTADPPESLTYTSTSDNTRGLLILPGLP